MLMPNAQDTYIPPSQSRRNDRRSPEGDQRYKPARADAFVIDDEDGICKFISAVLGNSGLASETFHSAQEVIVALERGHPDIVFLDIALGGSDAVEVIRALGKRGYAGIVQLMSGVKSALLDDVHRIGASHGLNMSPPLEKPFRKVVVQRAIASLPLFDRPRVTIALAPSTLPGLDTALTNGWLELWYQPKIDIRTLSLAGAEGLVRYRHPIHGVRSIDALLPQSNTETRVALTEHFLITALRDWNDLDHARVSGPVALKATFDVLANLDLAALAREHRPSRHGWPGLILEIGEHEVIRDINLAHEVATHLRIYDIFLSIDNFGAGFSSLERLRELPFTELKLHAGFVAGCAEDAKNSGICRAAVDLAHRFDIVAVADGVDNASDLQALRSMTCDVAQGSMFSEPMPKSQFIAALRDRASTGRAWST
jgi:EAL domain-containing protein (putative c-di-GMP-specific phosphodiesterase class I)/CheY-like chemotaxis protein